MVRERKNLKAVAVKQTNFLEKLFRDAAEETPVETLLEPVPEDAFEILVFHLSAERYGIPIEHVKEIIRFSEPTGVPHTVNFLDGIISLRGEMIPLINGRKRLGHDPKEPDKRSRIIVLQEGPHHYGILVDAAAQVITLLQGNIEPPPAVLIGVDAEFIQGVCEYKGQLIILLNLRRFLEFV
jgi:purine-binding chemotaxis protein CheW